MLDRRRTGAVLGAVGAGLCAALVATLVVGAGSAAAAGTFVDDDGNTHETNIEKLAASGVTSGCTADGTRYCPGDAVTRGQMATFLVRSLQAVGIPVPTDAPNAFNDDDGTTHELNADKLAEMGVARGRGGGTYNPSGTVSRGQMALFLQRAFVLPDGPATGFVDVPELYRQAVDALAAASITGGCSSDGPRYCPERPTTRDQMASFLIRAMDHSSQDLDASWEWGAAEPVEPDPGETPAPDTTSTPEGDPAGAPSEGDSVATSNTESPEDDPCALVTQTEWQEIAGPEGASEALEDGTLCGYRNSLDSRRLAIGALTAAGDGRYLTAEDAAVGQPLTGLGDRAVWLVDWPLAQTSTLVIESGDIDLVIELSSRRDGDDDEHREEAIWLAERALERI